MRNSSQQKDSDIIIIDKKVKDEPHYKHNIKGLFFCQFII